MPTEYKANATGFAQALADWWAAQFGGTVHKFFTM